MERLNESLITRYRPRTWDEVVGNKSLLRSLIPLLKRGDSHAFLFTGASGCGKTTIARLCANELRAGEVIEIDAATNNGVDDVRELIGHNNYQPLRGGARCVIIDECQAITAQAWKALLKSVEEPPPWLYWVFCTTEPNKVPAQIKTRCTIYETETISPDHMVTELLLPVYTSERRNEEAGCLKNAEILYLCADLSEGSPRKALSLLAQVIDCDNYKEAEAILHREEDEDSPVIQLARILVNRANRDSWGEIVRVLEQLKDENPESIRRILEAYVTKVILNSDPQRSKSLTSLLDMLTYPFHGNNIAPIVVIASRWTLGR